MEKQKFFDLVSIIAVLVLIIIGLCAYIFIDFRTDEMAAESQLMFSRAGMTGTARVLEDDIQTGDMVLAYHHAEEAAEYARLAGDDDSAAMFSGISESILAGTVDQNTVARIDGLLAVIEAAGNGTDNIVTDDCAVPTFASVETDPVEAAEKVAGRFFGGPVMTKGEKLSNGAILFSVSNAYAVIDGEKCVPIEAAISLPESDGTLTDGECVTAAMKFIADFFPGDVAASARVEKITSENNGRRANVEITSNGMRMTVTVRRDSGRVVRFTGGRE